MLCGVGIGFSNALRSPTRAAEHFDAPSAGLRVQRLDDRSHFGIGVVLVQDVDVYCLEAHLTQACVDVLVNGLGRDAPLQRLAVVVCALAQNDHILPPARAIEPLTEGRLAAAAGVDARRVYRCSAGGSEAIQQSTGVVKFHDGEHERVPNNGRRFEAGGDQKANDRAAQMRIMADIPAVLFQAKKRVKDVADGIQPTERGVARAVVGIALHGRYVIWPQHAVEPNFAIRLHARQKVSLAIIVPRLLKFLRRAAHIAEVHKENLVLTAEMSNDAGQVVSHEGEIALTQGDAVDRAGHEIDQPLVVLRTAHDPAHPTNR